MEDSEVVGLLGEVPIHIYTESLDRISETSEEVDSRTSSSMGGEEVGDSNKVKLYKRRWYIITVFSLFCLLQGTIFSSWSPIAVSTIAAFPAWTQSTISWQSNLALITSPLFQFPAWCLVAKFGVGPVIRWFTVFPLTICSMFRCIPLVCNVSDGTFTTITFITSICGGWASIIVFTTIGGLVAAWFPSGEQTLATGFGVLAINLGSILSSLVGPAFVEDPLMLFPDRTNRSAEWNQSHPWLDITWTLRSQIGHFMTFHFVLAVVVLALIIIYFPSQPDIPPEIAKSTPRLDPREGLRVACRDKNLFFLLVVNALTSLPFMFMMSMMDVTLKPFRLNEKIVGYLTTATIIVSGFLIIFTSKLNDRLPNRTKPILTILISLASVVSTILGFQTLEIISTSNTSLFIFVILSGSLLSCGKPIIMQAAAEAAYPVPEFVVTALLNQTTCLTTGSFLFLYSMSSTFASWSPLCLVISPILAILALSQTQVTRGCA